MGVLAGVAMAMMAAQAPAQQVAQPVPTSAPMSAPMSEMADAPVACPATPAALPADLAGWTRMTPVRAGATMATAAGLTLGTGARATLLPATGVGFALAPRKPGDAASSGGLFAFAAPAPGRYRVALGAGAWIDVVRDGIAVASIAHARGPACSGIRKMVDFDLAAGRYLLQIAGNQEAALSLMVVRLP